MGDLMKERRAHAVPMRDRESLILCVGGCYGRPYCEPGSVSHNGFRPLPRLSLASSPWWKRAYYTEPLCLFHDLLDASGEGYQTPKELLLGSRSREEIYHLTPFALRALVKPLGISQGGLPLIISCVNVGARLKQCHDDFGRAAACG